MTHHDDQAPRALPPCHKLTDLAVELDIDPTTLRRTLLRDGVPVLTLPHRDYRVRVDDVQAWLDGRWTNEEEQRRRDNAVRSSIRWAPEDRPKRRRA